MRRRWWPLLLLIAALLGAVRATAQDLPNLSLPGLEGDSARYAQSLTARFPAGGTPQQRRDAEQRAAAALARGDQAAAADALRTRIGAGQATPELWQALAAALLKQTPPEPGHALDAAWRAMSGLATGPDQIPALLVMAQALGALHRPAQVLQVLEAVTQRAPDDPTYGRMLADARRAAGMLLARITREIETEPARACLSFTVAPIRRGDFHPQDWVRLDPATPDAAITREGDQICVSGLALGATTRVTLRAGLPGEGGINLAQDLVVPVALGNRAPRISFDTRYFLLPRGQAPKISVATVNLSRLKLALVRISERNVLPWTRDNRLTEALESYSTSTLRDDVGQVVWEGSADIPAWQPNATARTVLPLPDALAGAATAPGLYALLATPGDGTPDTGAFSAQFIFRTDLAPTVWRGSDGLTVQVRGFSDAQPRPGAKLQLLAHNNDILAETTTDADGVGRFAAPLLHGDGPHAPAAVHAWLDQDLVALDLNTGAFDLSDRGVEGAPHPGPLDAFVWLDRGIYRPGETAHVMVLLRDAAGNPADVPAHVTIKRPNGQVFLDSVPVRGGDAALHLPVTLSPSAAIGAWTVEVHADPAAPPIGTGGFRVDAFVPDRMAVDAGPTAGPIVAGQPFALPVTARFLYGAPAAGLTGKANVQLTIDPLPFPELAGYRIGLTDETFAPDTQEKDIEATDAQGRTTLQILLPSAPDTTHAVHAQVDVEIDDPSGHAAHVNGTIPVRPAGRLIGIKPLFDGAVDAGTEAAFDIIAMAPDGKRAALPAKLRLVRERPDWRLVMHGELARYETVWRDEPLDSADVAIPADGVLHYAKRLPFGRYRLEVAEAAGLSATSVRFRSGWVASDSPDVPDKVDVSSERRVYEPGDTARIHIAAPFAGHATLLVVSDRVHSLRDVDVAEGGSDVDVKVDPSWGPGAYVAVHVFHAGGNDSPRRAIGLVWLGLDPAARTLSVSIPVPQAVTPRQRIVVPVHIAPGAWVTLAAVDEGVLRLTSFAAPDPLPHFLGRRTLGLDIRDDWGRLIPPAEGEATALRQGGDEGGAALPEIPQKIVSLFSPPVQAGADGIAAIALDLPDFNGQVRLMAVTWQGNRLGAANTDILVRDALVAEPLLPRFLAPGDAARFSVLLQNLTLPEGEAAARVTVDGPLALDGDARLAANLATGARAVPYTTLRATGVGRGVIHLDVTGPGGFHIQRETSILVRPARGPQTLVASSELGAGAQASLAPPIDRYLPGTWTARATFGGAVRFDAAALVRSLDQYPLRCLEQSTSRGLPLAFLPDGPVAGDQRAARLQASVLEVLDHQRFDGGFGLWSARADAEPWLSPYAIEFLVRARKAGAAVPDQAIADATTYLGDAADNPEDTPEARAAQAYRLYVLALLGHARAGAERVMFQSLDALPTPLAKAQLGAALAMTNDRPRAEAAFAAALAAPARKDWGADYGSALRDQAATAVLLKESGLLDDKLGALIAGLPGSDLDANRVDTQDAAWTAAAAALLGRDGKPTRISFAGTEQKPAPLVSVALTGTAPARNLGDRPVWQSVSITGVPKDAPAAQRSQMRITRNFFATDGSTLDLDHLTQNTVFVLVLEGRAEDGQDHRAMLLQGLPAGWEIAGQFPAGDAAGMSWLTDLSETEAQPATDDRYAAVVDLTGEKPGFRLAVKLRAVTPGTYEMPGAELSDMYRPAVFARQAANRITVLPLP